MPKATTAKQQQQPDEQQAQIEARRAAIEQVNPGGSVYYDSFREMGWNEEVAARLASHPGVTRALLELNNLDESIGKLDAAEIEKGNESPILSGKILSAPVKLLSAPVQFLDTEIAIEDKPKGSYSIPNPAGGTKTIVIGETVGMRALKGIGALSESIEEVREQIHFDEMLFMAQVLTGPLGAFKGLIKAVALNATVGEYLQKAQEGAAIVVTSLAHKTDYDLAKSALTDDPQNLNLTPEGREAWGRWSSDLSETQKGSLVVVNIAASVFLGIGLKGLKSSLRATAGPPSGAPGVGDVEPPGARRIWFAYGSRIDSDYRGRLSPPSVARISGNNITFESLTNASVVAAMANRLNATVPGARIVVGSGTHGDTFGHWASTDRDMVDARFFKEDVATFKPRNLPDLGPMTVLDMSKRKQAIDFLRTEQQTPPGTFTIAAWCYSTFSHRYTLIPPGKAFNVPPKANIVGSFATPSTALILAPPNALVPTGRR